MDISPRTDFQIPEAREYDYLALQSVPAVVSSRLGGLLLRIVRLGLKVRRSAREAYIRKAYQSSEPFRPAKNHSGIPKFGRV